MGGFEDIPKGNNEEEEQLGNEVPTTEALRAKRKALEARIAEARKRKEQILSQQVEEREPIIAERARIGEQLQEAEETLKFFEEQQEKGLIDEEGIAELETLRGVVSGLRETSNSLLERYDQIMDNPDVYDRVYDEAQKENQGIDRKQGEEELKAELRSMADTFLAQATIEGQRVTQADAAVYEKLELRDEAMKKADEFASPYGWRVERYTPSAYRDTLDQVKAAREKVGFFDFKRKSHLDNILKQRELFEDADKKFQEHETAKEEFDALCKEVVTKLSEEREKLMNFAYENEKAKELGLDHTLYREVFKDIEAKLKGITFGRYANKANNSIRDWVW